MMPMILRGSRVITLSAVENNVDLSAKAGTPSESLNVLFFNTANKGSSSTGTPAVRTGTGWKSGTTVYLNNSASSTITGGAGATGGAGGPGTPGSAGGAGASGAGGAGGNGTIQV